MEALVEMVGARRHDQLWEALKGELRQRLGNDIFDVWIGNARLVSESGTVLRLAYPSAFVLDWVRKRYFGIILSSLQGFLGAEASLELSVVMPVGEASSTPTAQPLPAAPPVEVANAAAGPTATAPAAPVDGGLSTEQTLESFTVGDSNRHAYNAAIEVLQRPGGQYNPLFLHGPSGVGKTHLLKGLARAFRARRRNGQALRVAYVTGEQFFQHYVHAIQERSLRQFQERYRTLDVLILDDVHLLGAKKKTQVEFLNTFTSLVDSGRQVVLSSDVPPRALVDLDPGLVGRFSSGLLAALKRPDLGTRISIVKAQGRVSSCRLPEEVTRELAESVRRSARELLGAVKLLQHHAQVAGAPLGLFEARRILSEYQRDHSRKIDLERITQVVGAHYDLSPAELLSESRERHVVHARQVAMYLARQYTRKSLAEVGKYFGHRNHTTVRCAEVKIEQLLREEGSSVSADLSAIKEILEE